jgi:ATP-dependent protease HslVU (ClpYQ) peptidase subunit
MNHSGEALIGLAGTHGDALEFLELLEEIFNEMAPFVFFGIVGDW